MEPVFAAAEQLAGLGGWEMDLRTGASRWTDELCRIHGLTVGCQPTVEEMLARIHPDDRQPIALLLETVAQRPEEIPPSGVTAEYRAVHPDGSERDVRFLGRMERDAGGRPARWFGAAQDVTEQRVTERELRMHYALSQALREWQSFDEGVVTLLRRLGTALEYPLAALWRWDDPARGLTCRAFWTAPGIDGAAFEDAARAATMRPGHGLPGRAWETRAPVVVRDVAASPWVFRRDLAAKIGIRSAIALPALATGGPIAVASFYSREEREPSDRVKLALADAGRELGSFLARHRGHLETRTLSEREIEIVQLAAEGCSGPAIAERLVVSPSTVKSHFENIYEKLGVGDRAAAVAEGLRRGLIR